MAVGIVTKGRASILGNTLSRLVKQVGYLDRVIVCYSEGSDVGDLPIQFPRIKWLQGAQGICCQRNKIMQESQGSDILLFLDDDFIADSNYLQAMRFTMDTHSSVVVATGHVIADGIKGPGLTICDAERLLASDVYDPLSGSIEPAQNGYGCNMAIRLSAVRQAGLFFDERLPLYGWYEDIDFTRRAGRLGRIVKVTSARGVHLGAKLGRTSGRRLGYSQVVNPIYLAKKGSYPWHHAFLSIAKNVAANLLKSFHPEPYVDRSGRLAGNSTALRDVLIGKVDPSQVLSL